MIGIIPKPAVKLPLWLNILFYFSIGILLFSILSYFILNQSLKESLVTLQNLEKELSAGKTPQKIALEKEILGFQEKIKDFSSLINIHKNPLNFFSVLENSCHPQVQFTNIRLELQDSRVTLSGKADSFQAVGQQIYLFQKESNIEKVDLTKLLLGKEGEAEFVLVLSLSSEIFK